MENPSVRFSGAPAGQPVQPSAAPVPPAAVPPSSAKPQEGASGNPATPPVTQEQVNEMVQKAFRAQQSLNDKAAARIQKYVDDQLKSFKDNGITLTQAQEDQLRASTAQRFRQELEPSSGEPPAQPGPGQQGTLPAEPPVTQGAFTPQAAEALVASYEKQMGITFQAGDPEIASIQADPNNPVAYVESYRAALAAKAARLQAAPGGQYTHPLAGLPILGGGAGTQLNPIQNINNLDDLWALAAQKKG